MSDVSVIACKMHVRYKFNDCSSNLLQVIVWTSHIFNTSWEYPRMHVSCKFGDSSSNLWQGTVWTGYSLWMDRQMERLRQRQYPFSLKGHGVKRGPRCIPGTVHKLITKSCHNTNFVATGGTTCHYDNLDCHHWTQNGQHDNSQFSVKPLWWFLYSKIIWTFKLFIDQWNIIPFITRRPFWKWRRWKSIGFCLWPPSTCIWSLKLKFQRKLDLCSGNHVVYRQTDGRTDGRTRWIQYTPPLQLRSAGV